MARTNALSTDDRIVRCGESIQQMTSRLFDRGFGATEIATAQLRFYSAIAPLGMSHEEAAAMLRETADRLDKK